MTVTIEISRLPSRAALRLALIGGFDYIGACSLAEILYHD